MLENKFDDKFDRLMQFFEKQNSPDNSVTQATTSPKTNDNSLSQLHQHIEDRFNMLCKALNINIPHYNAMQDIQMEDKSDATAIIMVNDKVVKNAVTPPQNVTLGRTKARESGGLSGLSQ